MHRALEWYSVPTSLQGQSSRSGPWPRRISPIFWDHAEIPTSSDLGAQIRDALKASRYLIVICSPNAAASRWVEEEVRMFKEMHGEGKVLGLIVAGEPNGSDKIGLESQECFPVALRHRVGPGAKAERIEPLASDIRPKHDSRRMALVRLVAGILGVDFDSLWKRDRRMRRRQKLIAAVATVMLLGVMAGLSMIAIHKSEQAKISAAVAETNRVRAEIASKKAKEEERLKKIQERLKLIQEYDDDMQSLPALWQQDRVDLVRSRLDHCATNMLPEDVRGFEWYYWNKLSHSSIATLDLGSRATSMDWSDDGGSLWLTDLKGRLVLWSVADGRQTEVRPANYGAYGVAAAGGGGHVAVLSQARSGKNKLEIMDSTGTSLGSLDQDYSSFSCLAFNPDGSKVVTGDTVGQVIIWNASSLDLIINLTKNRYSNRNLANPSQVLDRHADLVSCVTFSPNGKTVASADRRGGLAIWNSVNGKCLKRIYDVGRHCVISSVAFSRDGTKLATRSLPYTLGDSLAEANASPVGAGEILVWNKDASDTPIAIQFPGESISETPAKFRSLPIVGDVSAAFALGDSVIVTGVGNDLRSVDPAGASAAAVLRGHEEKITCLRVAPNNRVVASSDARGKILVLSLGEEVCGKKDMDMDAPARGLAISAGSGRRAVLQDAQSAEYDGNGNERDSRYLRLSEQKRITLFEGDRNIPVEEATGRFLGLAASKSGRYFATVSPLGDRGQNRTTHKSYQYPSSVWVWEFGTGKLVRKFEIPPETAPPKSTQKLPAFDGLLLRVRAVAFRGDDELFAIGLRAVYRFPMGNGATNTIDGFPIGYPPGIGYEGFKSKLYVPEDSAMCLTFSPDGRQAAFGLANGDVLLLDADTFTEVERFRGHRSGVTALCFSQDGRRLISCGGGYVADDAPSAFRSPGAVKVWDLNTGKECLALSLPGDHEFSGVALSDSEHKLIVSCNPLDYIPTRAPNGKLFSWDSELADPKTMLKLAEANNQPGDSLTGKELRIARPDRTRMGYLGLDSFVIHPSGEYIVAVDVFGTVTLLKCRSGEVVRTEQLEAGDRWCLKFLDGGSLLYGTRMPFGTDEAFLKFPELTPTAPPEDQTRPDKFKFNEIRSEDHSHSPDNAWALEADPKEQPDKVYVRNLATGELSKEPCAVEPYLRQFAFFPDNEHFATIGSKWLIHIWSVKTPAPAKDKTP